MLREFTGYISYTILGLQQGTKVAGAVEFLIYDTVKIFLLLPVIIFAASVIRSFFPPESTKRILSHKKEFIGNILAAFLGIVTPFCSCSAVPLFIGFMIVAIIAVGYLFNMIMGKGQGHEV